MDHPFHIHTDRKVNPSEFEALVIAAGACLSGRRVRPTSFHDHWAVRRSAAAYPFIAYARDPEGRLAGYITAFSDGAFSTFIGDLIGGGRDAHPVFFEHAGFILRARTVELDIRPNSIVFLPLDADPEDEVS